MRKAMGISEETADVSLKTIRSVFDDVSRRLMRSELQQHDEGNKCDQGRTTKMGATLIPLTKRKLDYLMDTESSKIGFTAADLTFCSLAAHLIGPPELAPFTLTTKVAPKCNTTIAPNHEDDMAMKELIPRELAELRSELRNTIAGQHVLEIYRKHRLGAFRTMDQTVPSMIVEKDEVVVSSSDSKEEEGKGRNNRCGVVIPKVVNRDKLPLKSDPTASEIIAAVRASNRRDNKTRGTFESKL